jgi:hypothetical protein
VNVPLDSSPTNVILEPELIYGNSLWQSEIKSYAAARLVGIQLSECLSLAILSVDR